MHSKLAFKDYVTAEFHQGTWNRYLMLGCVSAHIPWIAISNLKIRHLYDALQTKIELLSAYTLSNIFQREYSLTVDAIKQQWPSRNKVSLALDRWTSTNKAAITLAIGYYMDPNCTLR